MFFNFVTEQCIKIDKKFIKFWVIFLKKQDNIHKFEENLTSKRIRLVVKIIYSIKNLKKGSDKVVAIFGDHKIQKMFSLEVYKFYANLSF